MAATNGTQITEIIEPVAPNKDAQAWLIERGVNTSEDFAEINAAWESGDIGRFKAAVQERERINAEEMAIGEAEIN